MSISGPLYRRSPRLFNRNKPGDWTLVWCELHESGELHIFQDLPQGPETPASRRLVVLPIVDCDIAHVRSDGRECVEITVHRSAKKETLSSHESSYDVDWWMNTLLSVKRDLERGVQPRLSIVCPPSSDAPARQKSMRRPPPPSINTAGSQRQTLRRRQPTLEATITRFERYTIYETLTTFYIVCSDRHYTRFRMFSLDRTIERPENLAQILTEDPELYTWESMEDKLQTLAEFTRSTTTATTTTATGTTHVAGGKLVRAFTAVAIVGCIRFLRGYYFIFVTQRRKIGCIGGNFIYGISATQQLSVHKPASETTTTWSWLTRWLNPSPEEEAEARYLGLFHFIDLTKDFYFSYSYDVTHTLQHNMTVSEPGEPAEMFTWNEYLTRELSGCLSRDARVDLIIPLVLGCYEQRKCSVFGRLVSITLLARRSRHFAGTRYLKRGVADTGKAANDVETEQIIEDENMGVGKFSSFVQYRGSIPVFWSQETSATLPKPPIVLNRVDPTYTASRKHFAELFSRYGSPIVVLNLIKQSEKKEREVIVGNEFMNAVEYLNCFIPLPHRIRYIALDYSRLSKQKGLNVLHSLDKVAVWALTQTGFFCSAPKRQIGRTDSKQSTYVSFKDAMGTAAAAASTSQGSDDVPPPPSPTIPRKSGEWLEQKGVLRTNCIDCLDRTNVSQFSLGMRALGQQLYAMGIRNTPLLESRSQLVRVLMGLYSLVGDAISMQYGGSEAHKNVKNSAGRENVKHRELLTSIRRYYSNSFTDMAKQDAINIFLGHFVPKDGEPPLWELESDYYLHNFEVRNGTTACDEVRHSLEMQAESKRRALVSVPSSTSLWAMGGAASGGIPMSTSPDNLSSTTDAQGPMHTETTKDKRRREAYVRECKRLLEDWWKEPLDQFERPKYVMARDRLKRTPSKDPLGSSTGRPGSSTNSTTRQRKSFSATGSDTFLQMYHPEELTSFDKTLGYKFMSPMDLSHESNEDKPPRSARPATASIDASSSTDGASLAMSTSMSTSTRSVSTDESTLDVAGRRVTLRAPLSTRGVRSMSAPDITEEAPDSFRRQRDGTSRQLRIDESDPLSGVDAAPLRMSYGAPESGSKGGGTGRSFEHQHVAYKSALKRKDEQVSIEDYVQSRGHKKFVGDCTPVAPDAVYERYVHWNRTSTLWEADNESVKMYFESYLRDNNLNVDDAKALRDAQIRGGATFKVQTGPYAGLDQNVKARVLVAKKLKTDPEDRKIFEDSMDYKRLMSSSKSSIPTESLELYKSFFDDELPECPIYSTKKKPAKSMVATASDVIAVDSTHETSEDRQLAEDVRKMTLASRRAVGKRGNYDLISVGPLFKLDGGKDQDFILFNEAAAANSFADVIKNETELSFYAK